MKIVIAGGSGQVGTVLTRTLVSRGQNVVLLSRQPATDRQQRVAVKHVHWDAATRGHWVRELDGADVLINLAGRSVNCRYGARNRKEILSSRVHSTRVLGRALADCARPPRVWLQASTATIYAHRLDQANDEFTGILGGAEPGAPDTWRFSIDVARAWEAAATEACPAHTRLVLMRSAMVMSPDRGGIFDTLLWLVRRGLGGTAASGRQYISWIHEADFVAAIDWLIDHDEFSGPVNLAAPEPLPNAEFMRVLRQAWGKRWGLPATQWMLSIGAWLLRTETELILKSRRVVPGRLLDAGFDFQYRSWPSAARELCERWRGGTSVQQVASGVSHAIPLVGRAAD